jgi:hypothetical protein
MACIGGGSDMRRIAVILASIFLLVLYGCSITKNSYMYKGENETWTVQYKVTFNEGKYNSSFIATFKGDTSQLSPEKNIIISYQSTASGGTIIKKFNEQTYTFTSSGEGGAIENNNEVMNVTINIDGKIQTIELKK